MSTHRRSVQFSTLLILGVLLVAGAWLFWPDATGSFTALALLTVATFALMRYDKSAAQLAGARRLPERLLLLCIVGGGALGGLVGMLLPPRHKTRKQRFWVALLVGLALIGAWAFMRFGVT